MSSWITEKARRRPVGSGGTRCPERVKLTIRQRKRPPWSKEPWTRERGIVGECRHSPRIIGTPTTGSLIALIRAAPRLRRPFRLTGDLADISLGRSTMVLSVALSETHVDRSVVILGCVFIERDRVAAGVELTRWQDGPVSLLIIRS